MVKKSLSVNYRPSIMGHYYRAVGACGTLVALFFSIKSDLVCLPCLHTGK